MKVERVVVIQLARMGDILQTTPLLQTLKQAAPECRVTLLTAEPYGEFASHCAGVDQAFALDAGGLTACLRQGAVPLASRQVRWRELTAMLNGVRASRVFSLNLSPVCASLAAHWPQAEIQGWRWAEGGQRLMGRDWAEFVLNLVADRRLTRLHLSDILASYADPPKPVCSSLGCRVPGEMRQWAQDLLPQSGPKVVLQLGANSHLRRWPIEYHAALASDLIRQGMQVILVGSGSERVLGDRFISELGLVARRVINLIAKTGLTELAAVLQQSDLVISNDTGTLHLATAVGAKVLGLYMGPAVVHETGPYGPECLVLQARDKCGPCQEQSPICRGRAQCRRLLRPCAVYQAAAALLEGRSPWEAGAGLGLGPHAGSLVGMQDGFGQIYKPVEPQNADWTLYLGIALREAGRTLLRSGYEPDWGAVGSELREGYLACPPRDLKVLAWLSNQAAELAGAADRQDRAAAQALWERAPKLRPLAALVGAYPTARLRLACLHLIEGLEQGLAVQD